MSDLTLHRVDGRGRVNLDGFVDPGVEFYEVDKADDGVIRLHPVKVVIATTTPKRTSDVADVPLPTL